MSRRTKIIIAIVVVLLLVAIGVFLYFFFTRVSPPIGGAGEFPPLDDELLPEEGAPTVLPEEASRPFEPILRQLSEEPIAGAVLGVKSGTPIVRFVERATGNVHEIGAAGEDQKRLTNTTIPKVHEAIWRRSGVPLLARYTREDGETIETFSGRVVPGTSEGEGELTGTFLPRNITDAAIAPDGTDLFYLQEDRGGAVGIRSELAGSGKTRIWTSPVREWLVSWPAQKRIALLSKPSALAPGMLLSLDPDTGRSTLLLKNIFGLTALMNPVQPKILFSASSETSIALYVLDSATREERPLQSATLPEKCVWAKSGERLYCGIPKIIPPGSYPDVWYQGVVSFDDEVWSIDLSGGTERVFDLSAKRGVLTDLVQPQISPDEKFFVFTDKESGTLWSLQMKP